MSNPTPPPPQTPKPKVTFTESDGALVCVIRHLLVDATTITVDAGRLTLTTRPSTRTRTFRVSDLEQLYGEREADRGTRDGELPMWVPPPPKGADGPGDESEFPEIRPPKPSDP